jgi:hypothetical protein
MSRKARIYHKTTKLLKRKIHKVQQAENSSLSNLSKGPKSYRPGENKRHRFVRSSSICRDLKRGRAGDDGCSSSGCDTRRQDGDGRWRSQDGGVDSERCVGIVSSGESDCLDIGDGDDGGLLDGIGNSCGCLEMLKISKVFSGGGSLV